MIKKIKSLFSNLKQLNFLQNPSGRRNDPQYKVDLSAPNKESPCGIDSLVVGTNFIIDDLFLNQRNDIVTGRTRDGQYFIKIELRKNPRKENDLQAEAKIMKFLNEKGCISCPVLHTTGTITAESLLRAVSPQVAEIIKETGKIVFSWSAQEYIENCREVMISDIIFSVIEQKSLGVFQGDVKPNNLRFANNRVCYLIDYDQAVVLEKNIQTSSFSIFMDWCNTREKNKYGLSCWFRHFPGFDITKDLLPLFREEAFNLATTTLYKNQTTTNTASGVYHTLSFRDIFSDGIRDLGVREKILDTVPFKKGERILDVGCNAGLLSMYLAERGCSVTGGEMDTSMVTAAKMINNILGNKITFTHFDLDLHEMPGSYDTVMLFSVIHHSKNMVENCRKISLACKRVIIECRLVEGGKRPEATSRETAVWSPSSGWKYETLDQLYQGLEGLFPGFSYTKNYGQADKNRYVLELRKEGGPKCLENEEY